MAPKGNVCGQPKVASMKWQFPPETVYQVMTEQPDTCHRCGSRLILRDTVNIDNERVFVCECLECQRIIPVVEDDIGELSDLLGRD